MKIKYARDYTVSALEKRVSELEKRIRQLYERDKTTQSELDFNEE